MSNKQIKVPLKLITDVAVLLYQLDNEEYDIKLKNAIQEQINVKLEAMQKREQFTTYKTAPVGSDEREKARQEYIKIADISQSFVSATEHLHND